MASEGETIATVSTRCACGRSCSATPDCTPRRWRSIADSITDVRHGTWGMVLGRILGMRGVDGEGEGERKGEGFQGRLCDWWGGWQRRMGSRGQEQGEGQRQGRRQGGWWTICIKYGIPKICRPSSCEGHERSEGGRKGRWGRQGTNGNGNGTTHFTTRLRPVEPMCGPWRAVARLGGCGCWGMRKYCVDMQPLSNTYEQPQCREVSQQGLQEMEGWGGGTGGNGGG